MFVYQPTLSKLQLQRSKSIHNVIIWKTKEVFSSALCMLHTATLNSVKPLGYKMRIEFDNESLVVEQNNYAIKIVNA